MIFASVPVTLSQVDDLSEMGKDKDDIKAAGDAIDGLLRDTLEHHDLDDSRNRPGSRGPA